MVRNALFIQKVTCILLFIYQQTQLKTLYKSVDNFSLTFNIEHKLISIYLSTVYTYKNTRLSTVKPPFNNKKLYSQALINSMFISILYFYISEVYNVDNTYITLYNMFIMK